MASERCVILTREGYVERIHDCWRGQGMSAATHDVLMHHDAALRAEVDRLREALRELFGLVESGYLVRNTARDSEEGWALKQLPAIMTLKKAAAALKREEKP